MSSWLHQAVLIGSSTRFELRNAAGKVAAAVEIILGVLVHHSHGVRVKVSRDVRVVQPALHQVWMCQTA